MPLPGIITLSDFAADGGITIEPVTAGRTASKATADGLTHVDVVLDTRALVKIKVMAVSHAASFLETSYRAQEEAVRAGGDLPQIQISLVDRNTGETFSVADCYWQTIPNMEYNSTQGEREYTLEAPYGLRSRNPGTLIAPVLP